MPSIEPSDRADAVLELVARIPPGKVVTYGDVAEMLGFRGARFVGTVMSRHGSDVPWWRVIRAGGYPPQGLADRAHAFYLDEGTPLADPRLATLRVDLAAARWVPDLSETSTMRGLLHHVELWVTDLPAAERTLGWLLGQLGYRKTDEWPSGQSWTLGATYVVIEAGPDVDGTHERTRAGLNHLAFHAGSPADVDELTSAALRRGWSLMFEDQHPYAGGQGHYAAYLEDESGFEVELVAGAPLIEV